MDSTSGTIKAVVSCHIPKALLSCLYTSGVSRWLCCERCGCYRIATCIKHAALTVLSNIPMSGQVQCYGHFDRPLQTCHITVYRSSLTRLVIHYYYYYYYVIVVVVVDDAVVVSCQWPFHPGTSPKQRRSPPLRVQVSDCSTFRIVCDVPNTVVFFSESTERFLFLYYYYFFSLSSSRSS